VLAHSRVGSGAPRPTRLSKPDIRAVAVDVWPAIVGLGAAAEVAHVALWRAAVPPARPRPRSEQSRTGSRRGGSSAHRSFRGGCAGASSADAGRWAQLLPRRDPVRLCLLRGCAVTSSADSGRCRRLFRSTTRPERAVGLKNSHTSAIFEFAV